MNQSTSLSTPFRLLGRLALWQQILIGLTLGIATGLLFKENALVLAPIGTLFLNAIKMLIVPLVFVSLVAGITSMQRQARAYQHQDHPHLSDNHGLRGQHRPAVRRALQSG